MKHIVVVTLNFNTPSETHDCLRYLANLDRKDCIIDIIVIDNGSKETFVMTDKEKKENVILIRSEENLGFTGGNNVGLKRAMEMNPDYIMMLNNDTMVHKEMVRELLKVAEDNPRIGLVVPKIYFAKGHEYHIDRYKKDELGRVFWFAGGFMDWANVFSKHRGVDEVDHGQYDKTEETGFATGCCMFMRREALEEVGVLDDRYFLYYEDADLNQRILRAGYKIYYVPKAILWHITAASGGGSGSKLHDYFITRNRMLFGFRFAPLRSKIALIRESVRLLRSGREYQKRAIKDFYLLRMGKGTYFS